MPQVLAIIHRHTMGWHTYTSPQLKGLFVTGPDDQASSLRDSVPVTIKALVEAGGNRRLDRWEWLDSFQEEHGDSSRSDRDDILHVAIDLVDD